jgi:hypothetical protein
VKDGRSRLQLLAALSADGAVLVGARHAVAPTLTGLRNPARWVAEGGTDAAAGALGLTALWFLALWIVLGIAALTVHELSSGAHSRAIHLMNRMVPKTALRLAAVLTGLGVAAAPAAAFATAQPAPPGAACGAPCQATLPVLSSPAVPRLPALGTAPRLPTLGTTPVPRSLGTAPVLPARSSGYVVRPGDSLWKIAAEGLPPDSPPSEVAVAAARWWSANRAVIGPNPDLLHPGQVLSIPSPPEAA